MSVFKEGVFVVQMAHPAQKLIQHVILKQASVNVDRKRISGVVHITYAG